MPTPQEVLVKVHDLANYYTNIDFPNLASTLREAENALQELLAKIPPEEKVEKKQKLCYNYYRKRKGNQYFG